MEITSPGTVPIPDHYTYVTRSLIRLFEEGQLTNVRAIDVEPNYGHTTRITYIDDTYRITYGNDLGLNPSAATDLAKDKGHTKFMLRTIGVDCPDGEEFLLPWWRDVIAPSQIARGHTDIKDTSMAPEYIRQQLGYPVYVKAVDGSKGTGVHRVTDDTELALIFDEFEEKRVRVAVVEETVAMPDYRVVVLDGKLISAYERKPMEVIGDGKTTIAGLIDQLQERFMNEGRDTRFTSADERFERHLKRNGSDLSNIPGEGERIVLADISNLSAGGTSMDVSDVIHPRWVDLASFVAKNFNLRLCGVDLACVDITDGNANYSVLEVNASPGLDHYAQSGDAQRQIVDELYTQVFNALPTVKPLNS